MQKKLVDKLVDECTETVEEVKLANIIFAENENENSYKFIPCTVYIVYFLHLMLVELFLIMFIHNGI